MSKEQNNETNTSPFNLNADCVSYTNIRQGLIHITEDKLKVILIEHQDSNRLFYSWSTPLGIFLSCFVASITSSFNDMLGLSASTWQALFILSSIITGIWLILSLISAIKHSKERRIDDLIEKIKNDTRAQN